MAHADKVVHIKGAAHFDTVLKDHEWVVVDFYADWCGPCRRAGPVISALSNANPDITFVKVDVDSNEELAGRFRISGIPAFHVFHNRKAIGSVTGLDFDKIKHILDSHGKPLTSASEGEGRRGKGGRARGGGGEGGR